MKIKSWRAPVLALVGFTQVCIWASGFAEEEGGAAAVDAEAPANEKGAETGADPGHETQVSSEDYSRERKFRQAEQEFVNRDTNANLVIDEEEWVMIYQERSGAVPKEEWEQKPEKMKVMDSDKDGALSESEINAWIRERFETKFKRYTKSALYKSRKAEYDEQQAREVK